MRVLVICTCTPSVPDQPGPAPAPPAMVSVVPVARNICLLPSNGVLDGPRRLSKCEIVEASLASRADIEAAQDDVGNYAEM